MGFEDKRLFVDSRRCNLRLKLRKVSLIDHHDSTKGITHVL